MLLTHDVSTVTRHAYDRVTRGLSMPGVFALAYDLPIGLATEEILLLVECSVDGERLARCAARCRLPQGAKELLCPAPGNGCTLGP